MKQLGSGRLQYWLVDLADFQWINGDWRRGFSATQTSWLLWQLRIQPWAAAKQGAQLIVSTLLCHDLCLRKGTETLPFTHLCVYLFICCRFYTQPNTRCWRMKTSVRSRCCHLRLKPIWGWQLFTGQPTLQSWKCSDWRVSWTTSFSLGVPGWAVAEEEEAAVKPSNTFLNFFIFFR